MPSFWSELRRRNVVKFAVAYAIVGWLLVEISSVLLPAFEAPHWVLRVVILLIGLGFVIGLFLSWAYNLTPQGIVRADAVPASESNTKYTNRKLDHAIIAMLLLVVGFLVLNNVFVGDETLQPAEQPAQKPVSAVKVTQQKALAKSIAVLAFEDLSPDGDQEYFSDGISEELLNLLSQVKGLKVTSRTSSFSYKGTGTALKKIAAELDVTHVLEGSVRKAGNQIRITAQLIEAATDTHLWSQNYTRELTNVFDIQDEIAANVVEALQIELLGDSPIGADSSRTDAPEAHDAYLLGRHHLLNRRTEELLIARDYFRSAIELDPDYAAPYVGLADAYIVQHMYGVMLLDELIENAEPVIERALQLDPSMGQAYASKGWVEWQKGDWAAAGEDFRRAISLSPSYATAHQWYATFLFFALHRPDEAVALMESALALDPLSPIINQNAGRSQIWQGNIDRGLAYFRRANEIAPRFPNFYKDVGELEAVNGRLVEAQRLFRRALSLDSGNPYLPHNIAYSYLVLGDLELAQRWFDVAANLFGEKPAAQLMREYIPLIVRGEDPERLSSITPQVDDWDIDAWIYYRPVGRAHMAGKNLSTSRAFYSRLFPELFSTDESPVIIFNANAAVDVAWILRSEGDVDRADSLLNQTLAVTSRDGPIGLVSQYLPEVRALAMLGRKTEALVALRQAIDDGWREAWWLTEADPTLESIVRHPDFIAMVDEVEADVASQLEKVRELERNGEFAPVPDIVVAQ